MWDEENISLLFFFSKIFINKYLGFKMVDCDGIEIYLCYVIVSLVLLLCIFVDIVDL